MLIAQRRRVSTLPAVSFTAVVAVALVAQAAAKDFVRPERLTSGPADQFLGALDPAGQRLFYVSNENSTTQIFGADMTYRVPELLFDEAADVTWPRVSPDGRRLLYISYRSSATGQLCIRDLPGAGIEVGPRRCFPTHGRSALQAIWAHDGSAILLLSRDKLGGTMDLRRLQVSGSGQEEVLLTRDLSSPSVSPNGRWLIYVPITRVADRAGAFGGRAGAAFALVRLDGADRTPLAVTFDLPGKSGFPTFSPDGRYVYFSQYLNDTNSDGVVDGNDHGVLFRVPFDGSKSMPIDGKEAEQLTSAAWDCQYPFPVRDRLITTCLYEGSLDVFSLPLSGSVPRDWDRARLLDEIDTDRSPWDRLLVHSRLYLIDDNPTDRALQLKRIIELHLSLHEYRSTEFYAEQLERLAAGRPGADWQEEAGIAAVLREIGGHRQAVNALSEGQLSAQFVAGARARLARLAVLHASRLPTVAALASLAMSEVDDTLGDKAEALSLIAETEASAPQRPVVMYLLADRARDLYGPLNERDRLLAVYATLSRAPCLSELKQLEYAQDYVELLVRGRSHLEQKPVLDGTLQRLDPGSNLAFVITLQEALSTLTSQTQEAVRARVLALYARNPSFDRRRTLVHTTIARAAATNSEALWYGIADTWVKFVDDGRAERRRTEALYRKVVLERAYVEWSHGELDLARQHFDAVTVNTQHLESHAGYIDTSLQEGKTDLEAEYARRFAGKPDNPELRFGLAYLRARRLAHDRDEAAFEDDVEQGVEDLAVAMRSEPNSIGIQHLWGYFRHEAFLRTGDRREALRANAHYLIALDLAHDDPRYRAAILSAIGFLQARVGNHAIAIGYFNQREKLPFLSRRAELGECLIKARCLLHADRDQEAAALSDRCVSLASRAPELQTELPLALDRSALDHFAAGDFAGAKARYDRLQPMVDGAPMDAGGVRNRFVLRVVRAAAELGVRDPRGALTDLQAAQQLLERPGGIPAWRPAFQGDHPPGGALTPKRAQEDNELLFTGLRAQALAELKDWAGARAQLERRLKLIRRRLGSNQNREREAMAQTEAGLGAYAFRQGDLKGAVAHVEAGLRWADELDHRMGTQMEPVGFALLREYAQLHFEGHVPLAKMAIGLPERLAHDYALLCDRPDPKWAKTRARFGLYLDRLALEGVQPSLR